MSLKKSAFCLACAAAGMLIGCSYDTSAVVDKLIEYDCPVEKFCDGNELYTCYKGSFIKTTCPSGCDAVTKKCKTKDGNDCAIDECDTKDKNNKKIYKCEDGKLTKTAENCPDDFTCKVDRCIKNNAECINDKCENNHEIKKCIDGKWDKITLCEDPTPICSTNYVTKEGSCVDKCKDKCLGEKIIQKCDQKGNLQAAKPCPDGEVCIETAAGAACTAKVKECKSGTMKCLIDTSQNSYLVCNGDGEWDETVKECPTDKPVCTGEDGEAKCVECKDGSKKCSNDLNKVLICKENHWPDESSLNNNKFTYIDCTSEQKCELIDNIVSCVNKLASEKCEPVCDGDKIKNCDNGTLQAAKPCPNGEVCRQTNAGAACAAKDMECPSNTMQCLKTHTTPNTYKCGNTGDERKCDEKTPICITNNGYGKCVECMPGKMKCSDMNSIPNTYQECNNDGKWGAVHSCSTNEPVCTGDDGNAVCKCKDGETKCNDNKTGYYHCFEGQWKSSKLEDCQAKKQICVDEEGEAKCISQKGSYRCTPLPADSSKQKLQYYNDTDWEDVDTCDISLAPKPKWCNAERGACVYACDSTKIESVCMSNDLFKCDNGLFVYVESCKDICITDQNGNAANCGEAKKPCYDSDQICLNKKIITCGNGEWNLNGTPCNPATPVCISSAQEISSGSGTETVTHSTAECKPKGCDNGKIQCDENGTTLQQCNNNEWEKIGKCSAGFKCKENKCVKN